MREPFRSLISAAVLAPSGDNMQPWRFVINEDETSITVYVDETRDMSPMNAGQRMSRMACGAAIENIIRTARFNGWDVSLRLHDSSEALATIRVSGNFSLPITIDSAVKDRHTNRRIYNHGSNLTASMVKRLQQSAAPEDGVRLSWITDRDLISHYAKLVSQADALMFGNRAYLQAFLDNVRFDEPSHVAVAEGLSIGSLGLSAVERLALPQLTRLPGFILQSWPMQRAFRAKARRVSQSCCGLCIIGADRSDVRTFIAVGRTMQRAWLALTENGLAVQPMMSLSVLFSSLQFSKELDSKNAQAIESLRFQFEKRLNAESHFGVLAILRFGYSSPAPYRTGRRSIEQSTIIASPEFNQQVVAR